MQNNIIGKHILLVIPNFHGYELAIHEELMRQGLIVTIHAIEGFTKKKFSAHSSIKKYWAQQKAGIIRHINDQSYDFFLVINLDFIDADIIHLFKEKNPKSKTIIYLWDSLKNLEIFRTGNLLLDYDYRYSFEYEDCLNYPQFKLKHRPTFFHPYINTLKTFQKAEYDIASVMSTKPDRIKFINDLAKLYTNIRSNFHIHLSTWKSIPAYLINHSVLINPKYIRTQKLTIFQTLDMLNRADCILDMPVENQLGLTLRSLDALGMNKKLVTTNQDIVKYDFYNKNNILIMPPGRMEDIVEFLKLPLIIVPDEIRNKYTIQYWVTSILLEKYVQYTK